MKEPRHAADFLKQILKDVGTRAGRARFVEALETVLGAETSAHVRVTGFKGARLYVEVDSAPLFAELTGFRREEIREACNEILKPEQIGEIVFRMGGTGHV